MKLTHNNPLFYILAWLLAFIAYAAAMSAIDRLPRVNPKDTINVAIPPLVQTLLAGGDRYLAGNIAVFRALVVSTANLDKKSYAVLAKIQTDAARMNPAHEDNYYISQAILPWAGEVKADLFIQKAATDSRAWDFYPAFFLGFDRYYFLKDPVAGAKAIEAAADRSPDNRQAFINMAVKWYELGDDPRVAIGLISAMSKGTRDKEMKLHLENRVKRLSGLAELRDAAKLYNEKTGKSLVSLQELVSLGLLAKLPADPQGSGYTLDAKGIPIFAKPAPEK